jgi:hypothetical protein
MRQPSDRSKATSWMLEYSQELHRRVGQFTDYLKKMFRRAHEEVHGSSFIIFNERPSSSDHEADALAEAAKPALQVTFTGLADNGINSFTISDSGPLSDLRDDGWKAGDSSARFIQFSFERDWFCLDMPLQTLYQAEAEQILRFRQGFFYLRDRPQFTLYGEDVDGYDPFRKIYIYGDEESAAEDMAFIFFQVWRFPVDWRFYVRAAAFGDKKISWETNAPLE